MKQIITIIALTAFSFAAVHGDVLSDCKAADKLHKEFKYADENTLLVPLLDQAKTPKEKTEAAWRLARVTLYLGDDAEGQGIKKEDLLKYYEKGQSYADIAIASFPNNALAYYWKASNMGRWGQVKGIFDSLGKAEPMQKLLIEAIEINSEHADSYYVLGELYDELPGWPLSFGNMDFAVSFARKSIAINEDQVKFGTEDKRRAYYIKLATHLYKRNSTAAKRKADQKARLDNYNSKTSMLEKNGYFEGTVQIKDMSDRDEAKEIMNALTKELEDIQSRNKEQSDDLKDIKDIVKGW